MNGRRRMLLAGLALLFIAVGAAYAAYWMLFGRFEVSTDDAYVAGNLVALTPQVNGTVTAIRADDTQLVQRGEALVLLDNTDARIALSQAQAQLAKTVRQVQQLYQTEAEQRANVALQQAKLAQTLVDYRRRKNLVAKAFVPVEDFQHVGTQVDMDRASLKLAEHQLAATQAVVAHTDLADHPEVNLAAAAVRDAYVALQRTTLLAPVTGYVAQRRVQIGQRVSPGMALLAIVPLNQVWTEANFKESQLSDVRIGQPVTLTSDLYGSGVVYRGHVIGLGAGTGSAFAVLPPQNATGNWIKVVQRVPVRIGFDRGQIAAHPLRIGLSMEVSVDTHDRSGAALPDRPQPEDGYATTVYDAQDQGAASLIARIIRENTVTTVPSGGAAPALPAAQASVEPPPGAEAATADVAISARAARSGTP